MHSCWLWTQTSSCKQCVWLLARSISDRWYINRMEHIDLLSFCIHLNESSQGYLLFFFYVLSQLLILKGQNVPAWEQQANVCALLVGSLCSFTDLFKTTPLKQHHTAVRKGWSICQRSWYWKLKSYLNFQSSTYSPSVHSALWVPAFHHRPASLHPLCGHVGWPAIGHHLAERWPTNPSQPGRHCGQHWLHQFTSHQQPDTWPQWQLHLHRPQWGCSRGAPESAYCERWELYSI